MQAVLFSILLLQRRIPVWLQSSGSLCIVLQKRDRILHTNRCIPIDIIHRVRGNFCAMRTVCPVPLAVSLGL